MPTPFLSSFDKTIVAFNIHYWGKIYFFDSTLKMNQTTISILDILEALYKNFFRTQIYYTFILKYMLQMYLARKFVFNDMIGVLAWNH
jgi:hypothetical protein